MKLTFNDKKIIFYLNQIINEKEICNKILKIKKDKDNNDNLNFYINLWENIAGSFYESMEIHKKFEARLLRNSEFLIQCDLDIKYPIETYYKLCNHSYESRKYLLYMINKKKLIPLELFRELDNTYSIISKRCSYRQKKYL